VWSELQKISKSNTSVFSSTFSELDVQHNYLFQLISNKRELTKSEFQSILRIILFPSRRLIRHINENYSVFSLTKKSEKQISNEEKNLNTTLSNINNSLSTDSSSSSSSDIATLYGI